MYVLSGLPPPSVARGPSRRCCAQRLERRLARLKKDNDRLRLELEKAHTYEVPEVLAVPVVEGSPNYLNWLENELGPPGV